MTQQNKFSQLDLFISIEHLAIFLDLVSKRFESNNTDSREVPGYLNKGRPNLIVCPSTDQIKTVLSMYASNRDRKLPFIDEVLYCNGETSSEEVENFMRIAFKSNGSKIYCLMNINELTYANSKQIDEFLTKNISNGQCPEIFSIH